MLVYARKWVVLPLIWALAFTGAPVFTADLRAQDYELTDISVTATRTEQDLTKLPRNVTVVTREEIEALNPSTVTEVLQAVPGLVVRDFTGTGASANVDLRGFGETGNLHTLVTVDGRRLNQIDLSGVDFTTIPVENIERIEILHGPACVPYGDAAVGGVINIVTKRGGGALSGQVQGRYGSYDLAGFKASLQGGSDKTGFFVSARHDALDGYRDNSETRLKNFTFNTHYDPTDTLSLLLDGSFNDSDFSLPGSLTEAQMEENRRQASTPDNWAENRDSSLRFQVQKEAVGRGVLTADLSYRRRDSNSRMWSLYDTDIDSWGFQPKYVLDRPVSGLANRITVGLDYYQVFMTNTTSNLTGVKQGTVDYDHDSMGLYVLDELSLTDRIVISLGVRHQRADYVIDTKPVGGLNSSETVTEEQLAWSTGLAYSFTDKSKVYVRAAKGFRYPTVEEYVTYGVYNALVPEKILNYEMGVEYTFMPGGRFSLAVYTMAVEDEIAYNPATWANENLDETRHTGVEADLRLPLGQRATLFSNLTFQNATFAAGDYDGKRIPLVPEWKGALGLSYRLTDALGCGVRANYVGPRPFGSDKNNDYGELDGYTTVDLNLDYRWSRYRVSLNAANILGEKYSPYAYAGSWGQGYYPAPEASFWLGLGVDF